MGNVGILVAVGIDADGRREVIAVDGDMGDPAGWGGSFVA